MWSSSTSQQFFSSEKINSNLAKSDSWSTERKYFGKINEIFSCVLTGIGLGVTNLTVLHHSTMLNLGCYSKSTERSTWMCHLFCCRVNTHTAHRATLLSHRFATIPQSLEICLLMQKIGAFPNTSHQAVVGSREEPQTCFGFSHPWIRTCCCLAEPLETFQNLWEIVKRCLQVFASHYHTQSPCLPATKHLGRDHFKWQYLQYLLLKLCWRGLGWASAPLLRHNYWQGLQFGGENQATSKK